MKETTYMCSVPVVLIIFNRPDQTRRVLQAISRAKPAKLFVISDGPRASNHNDAKLVAECRELIENLDWECEVYRNFSDINLGCRRRINSGLDWVFDLTEEAIILEDDCLPVEGFFRFMEWGLSAYRDNTKVGMVSGSNLIDFASPTDYRNGFSKYINIWGWGSWRRVWRNHDQMIALSDVKRFKKEIKNINGLSFFESLFWTEVFKNALVLGSTWDFQLQHSFFRLNYLSVYPKNNLVENLGFGHDGTHTTVSTPQYIEKSKPKENLDIMNHEIDTEILAKAGRDGFLIKTIWHYSPVTAIRLWLTNLWRFLNV